ncbi:MAG: Gfo/Idh/MocA family oxidoreductase [Ignavibacteriaceae bacterium]
MIQTENGSKVSWGVISTANIGLKKVIPAIQQGNYTSVTAIASRDYNMAKKAAAELNIPKAYGSYEQLLADKEIDAIYIPLPNHLHVEWTIKSLEAGKHVLCEKPISINYGEAVYLNEQVKRFPKLKVMEAFMYKFHPQWQKIKDLIASGAIGELRNIHALFSYYNVDPDNVRNKADIGGGGLLDIGCYCISAARFIFEDEPLRVAGIVDYDPELKIDRLASGVMEFKMGTATFTCSTQLKYDQGVEIFGTEGKIKVYIPFTPMPDIKAKVLLQKGETSEEFIFDECNQYTIQGDMFSLAVLNNREVPANLSDALGNMKVIDSIFQSSREHSYIEI